MFGKKNEITVKLEPDVIQMLDSWVMLAGVDRKQIVNLAILQFLRAPQVGTPETSESLSLDKLDFSALESFIKG